MITVPKPPTLAVTIADGLPPMSQVLPAVTPRSATELPQIEGYEILTKLGEGGMGAVYKARQPVLNRLVALKVMSQRFSDDATFVARFVREAAAAANLSHPNLVQVFAAGKAGKTRFIAMEFVEGRTLSEHIKKHGRLDAREAVAVAIYVAQALQHAWNKARLIHRDIKPENVFLSYGGEVKVGDLGLAKSVSETNTELTTTGMTMGSPHYISPEQVRAAKDIDFRTDIYSLGCTLFHMLTGQPPFDAEDSFTIMTKHVNDPPPPISKVWPDCPAPLMALLEKMLAKDRVARPQSYENLIEELLVVHGKLKPSTASAAVNPISPVEPTKSFMARPVSHPSRKRTGVRLAVAGAAFVVALAGLWSWSLWKDVGSPQVTRLPAAKTGELPSLEMPSARTQVKAEDIASTADKKTSPAPRKSFAYRVPAPPPATSTAYPWTNSLGMKFVPVPGTSVQFSIWDTRVQDYEAFVTATGRSWKKPPFEQGPTHPAVMVTWDDAKAFCAWLTEKERREGKLTPPQEYRLPTDLEWSAAVGLANESGNTPKERDRKIQGVYPWGTQWPPPRSAGNYPAPLNVDDFPRTSPVGSFAANRFGLYDMGGNVWQWCEDAYNGQSGARVLRGPSWLYINDGLFLSSTRCFDPGYPTGDNGFRCVLAGGGASAFR